MLELADIVRQFGAEYLARYGDHLLPSHRQALTDIAACRTPQLGGHVYLCKPCQQLKYEYHSCQNRHCPKCQNQRATLWLQRQSQWLLPTDYYLGTSTLPAELRPVARSHQRLIYNILFQAAAESLQKLALDPRFLGGMIGMIAILQTWKSDLGYHPHIHFLIVGGAVTPQGRWRFAGKKFFLPAPALSPIFRAKFRDALKKTSLFSSVPSSVWTDKKWVVDCRYAGSGQEVLKYFAPYIYRVAISNRRLVKLENGQVTFRCKDRKKKKSYLLTLPALEFLSRFLQHVLPRGFIKVRYYGFLHPKNRKLFERVCWALGGDPSPRLAHTQESSQGEEGSKAQRLPCCPLCGHPMTLIENLHPQKRGPP